MIANQISKKQNKVETSKLFIGATELKNSLKAFFALGLEIPSVITIGVDQAGQGGISPSGLSR